jgi:UDP-glucose 4-epimerase
MKIIVFGGGGFIGSATVDRLLHDGHEIRVFERPRIEPYRSFSLEEKLEWVTGEFMSIHDISEAITGMDAVLHLISTTLPKNSNENPIYDVQSNLIASIQLLDAMVAQNVKRIVFISSGGTVYGHSKYLPIDEQHPTEPNVSYGITKLAIEKFLLLYQKLHGIKTTILRVANPYGERQRIETAQGAISVFIQNALSNKTINIWGDGSATRDYIYIQDVADAFARAVVYDGSISVFNIATGIGTNLNKIITILEQILERKVLHTFHPPRHFDVPVNILGNTLAKDELGWKPNISLKNGVFRTLNWIKMNSIYTWIYFYIYN